jgi:alkylation response protein AidB-like acyl-CoA dehydrogenase
LRGTRIVETWDHLGLRASGSHDVIFEDVAIPADHAIDVRPQQDWASSRDAAMQGEMSVILGSLYDGVARAARDWLLTFLRERKPSSLGAALATLPRAQEAVGGIEALLFTNARLIESLAREVDAGHPPHPADSGLAKHVITTNAIEAVQAALSLTSNHGLSRLNPLERHLRDVLCGRVHTPQDDSVRLASGRRALDI